MTDIIRTAMFTGASRGIGARVARRLAAHGFPGPFGGTVEHGYLMLRLAPMLIWQIDAVDGGDKPACVVDTVSVLAT